MTHRCPLRRRELDPPLRVLPATMLAVSPVLDDAEEWSKDHVPLVLRPAVYVPVDDRAWRSVSIEETLDTAGCI
jgi:hypothetical protein